jgi:7-cyano-7-deazaguanine synthase
MSVVTLVSGGLDSSLMALLAKEAGAAQYPLFFDYGQLAAKQEWKACLAVHERFGLPRPVKMDLSGFGRTVPSGLSTQSLRINEDAFLPCRNLVFLVAGGSYAYAKKASAVMIGLLNEAQRIFPDQSAVFLTETEKLLEKALAGVRIRAIAPLMNLTKRDVLRLAEKRGISGTYSCHSGRTTPCGLCVSCKEMENARRAEGDG